MNSPFFCCLPKFYSILGRHEELVAFLHTKCLVPSIDLWEGSVYAPFAQSVRVALSTVANLLVGDVGSPYASISDKEALLWSKTMDSLERLLSCSILKALKDTIKPPWSARFSPRVNSP